jgi:NAD(P)-dependent dehydrogenase (short-subunit alcohol dehydrogenase family)
MKSALVTGANKGIGLEVAKQLAQHGYFVYLGSRTLENGEAAVQQLNARRR